LRRKKRKPGSEKPAPRGESRSRANAQKLSSSRRRGGEATQNKRGGKPTGVASTNPDGEGVPDFGEEGGGGRKQATRVSVPAADQTLGRGT